MFSMKTASLAFLMATSAFAAPIAKRGAYVPVRVPFLGITCLLRDIPRMCSMDDVEHEFGI